MKVTVLGSGGFGYPLVFCGCENCNKARIVGGKNIRKRASILINDEMLIDLTPDSCVAMGMYGKDMSKVKYLLQTHTHLDHFDANHFITLDSKYGVINNGKLNLICSNLCFEDINFKISQYEKMDLYDSEYLNKINLQVSTINHGESLVIGDYLIKAIHCTHHENIGAQIYLIKHNNKTLLYATDTTLITDIALEELKGFKINCVFLDESFGLNDYMAKHLNIKGFKEYILQLKNNNLIADNCKIFATHITHDGNPLHDELEEILAKDGASASYDGMEIEIWLTNLECNNTVLF